MTKLTVKEFNRRIERGKVIGEDELVELVNHLHEENINLKQALWEAEEEYLHEAYRDNPIRLEDKMIDLKEEWDREYWNDYETIS